MALSLLLVLLLHMMFHRIHLSEVSPPIYFVVI